MVVRSPGWMYAITRELRHHAGKMYAVTLFESPQEMPMSLTQLAFAGLDAVEMLAAAFGTRR